jgi:hypothetical protein
MTFAAACGWSLARSVLIAAVGLWLAVWLQRLLSATGGPARRLLWVLLLAPFLSPGLIVGYGYRNYSLSLVHYPQWNEALYAAIVLFQAVPVGVLLLHFAPPPPVASSGLHCLRLLTTRRAAGSPVSLCDRLRVVLRGPTQVWMASSSVMFLVAFQEAEVAALMQARGWAEWLFTRQAGLVDVAALLRYVAVLICIQSIVCLPVLNWMHRAARESRATADRPRYRVGRGWLCVLFAACALNAVIPGWLVLSEALRGVPVLWQQPSFWREVLQGLLFATTAGVLAVVVARWMRREGAGSGMPRVLSVRPHPRPLSRDDAEGQFDAEARERGEGTLNPESRILTPSYLLLLPGLCGSMTLSLLVGILFQQPVFRLAYDTPVPLVVAQMLLLLPRTMLLFACLPVDRTTPAVHASELLRAGGPAARGAARELRWQLAGRPQFWGFVIVFFWGYLDLMTATILAPPGMEPVVKRLYNFMHFGHIAGLAAMVCATLAVPLLLVSIGLLGRRVWSGWRPT